MTPQKIVANILGFIALSIVLISAGCKQKKHVLFFNIIAQIIMIISNVFAGLYFAIVQEVFTVIRDVAVYKEKDNKPFRIILLILIVSVGLLVTIFVNENSVLGYIGTLAGLISTLNIFYVKKRIVLFKFGCALVNIIWFIVYIFGQVYTTAIFNIIACVINVIVAFIIIQNNKKSPIT